jgi:hypothetical protein
VFYLHWLMAIKMTHQERLLNDFMILDARWAGAASGILLAHRTVESIGEAVGVLSQVLVIETLRDERSMNDLRHEVSIANGLDREAVELSQGDIETLGRLDKEEALARRIAHHSERTALNALKSRGRRRKVGIQLWRNVSSAAQVQPDYPDLSKFGVY